VGRLEEAQHYMDEAVAAAQTGLARRASLFHGTQNLIALGRLEEAVDMAQRFRDACSRQDLAYYLEGMARRRLGQAEAAIALFEKVSQPTNEDSFTYPLFMLRAERAGALLEADRAGEAADELALLVEDNPDVRHITAALKAFAVAGKSIDALVAAMPADRLERVGAALTLVPAEVADQMAEALWARFGPRPQLLAAAIRFAPNLNAARALEWSARVRAIGMAHACPLVARAADPGVPATERVRAAVTAHAAFADQRGAARALDAAPLVATADVGAVLAEVALLGPAILAEWAGAAMGTHGEAGDRDQRRAAIAQGLAKAGHTDLAAQSENAPAALSEDQPLSPQLTGAGADR
jgi:hypothetical protein